MGCLSETHNHGAYKFSNDTNLNPVTYIKSLYSRDTNNNLADRYSTVPGKTASSGLLSFFVILKTMKLNNARIISITFFLDHAGQLLAQCSRPA